MIQIDGAKLDISARTLEYHLPKPFGPDKGTAFVRVFAKPANSQNSPYQERVDKLFREAKVKDLTRTKRFERNNDANDMIRSAEEDGKMVAEQAMTIRYEECIVSWETNIQSDGKNLEPNKENFIALSKFDHPALKDLFEQLRTDMNSYDLWLTEAEAEIKETEKGN